MLTTEYNEKKQMELFYEEGMQRGVEQGMQQGMQQGESRLARLMNLLFAAHREHEAALAASDPEYRQRLYAEFQLT